MKKELNELTESQARKIADLIAGRKFVSFSCDKTVLETDGFFRACITLDEHFRVFIFSSGNVFLMGRGNSLEPLNAMLITDYLRSEGFNLPNQFDKNVTVNDENRIEMIKSYFKNMSEEKLAEFTEIAEKYSDAGPTVEEYFYNLSGNYPTSDLSKLTSGKIMTTIDMTFSCEKFHGIKLIDDPNFNFNLIEVVEATEHPLKKVEEGIRVYRVEAGRGCFTLIRQDSSFDQIEVKLGDTILIKAGDSYKYEGNNLKLFEVNIKYP